MEPFRRARARITKKRAHPFIIYVLARTKKINLRGNQDINRSEGCCNTTIITRTHARILLLYVCVCTV